MFCGLIVRDVELDLETFCGEFAKLFIVCLKDGNVVKPRNWYGKNSIGFLMIHDQEQHEREGSGKVIVHNPTLFVCECPKTKHVCN